jgi:uncharacterized protein YgiM (DUF1202 family)
MRGLQSSCIAVVLTFYALAAAQADESPDTFPYVAYIAADGARVHAGPGNAYYATDELTRGQKVEVYQKISGWLAIRPPVNSFSWIPAADAELTDEPDVAMILHDDVPAWIGTRVERDAEHLWQIQLNEGDHVQVLDVKRRITAAGKPPQSWYRIEPPEGELRFIREADVTREEAEATPDQAPEPLKTELANTAKPLEKLLASQEPEAGATPTAEEAAPEESVLKAQFTPRDRTRTRPTSTSQPERAAPTEKESPFKDLGQSSTITTPRLASLERMPPTDTAALLSASSRFDDRIAEVELELAQMAAKDPREWKLDALHTKAEALLASGQTTLERGRARLVLDKIQQFEALYLRAVEANEMPRTAGLTSVSATGDAATSVAPVAKKLEALKIPDGVTYDGVGWLKPVYSAKRIAPPYALVDVDGKVLQYVTPAPGLNLNRYVKKPVGIFGQRSQLTEFNAAHITASKVVDLTKYQEE